MLGESKDLLYYKFTLFVFTFLANIVVFQVFMMIVRTKGLQSDFGFVTCHQNNYNLKFLGCHFA
jgi:hypothetical protein